MKKKLLTLLVVFLLSFCLFAEDPWWVGKKITGFDLEGLKNASSVDVGNILYSYRGQELTEEVISNIEKKMLEVDGIISMSAGAIESGDSEVRVYISITEKPFVSEIKFEGNSKVKKSDLLSALTKLKTGTFIDLSDTALLESARTEIQSVYTKKGFESIPVKYSYNLDQETNKVSFLFTLEEGVQSRIVEIAFEGNNNATDSVLKKSISSKAKSLFNQGYLDLAKLSADAVAIVTYYQTVGYVDAAVTDTRIEEVPPKEGKESAYRDVKVTFVINEGEVWYYGGMDVKGNTIFPNEDFDKVLTLREGNILNLSLVEKQYNAVADIYYDNGYISNIISIEEDRNQETKTIRFHVSIVEGPQAVIEKIIISGLTKTREYVMRRELTLKEGDVFSKAKLQTSAQNLYNTGLLSDLNYDMYYGEKENSVVIDFKVVEGNQMDIQFGATFGGTVKGFPVSGFLQWADRNLAGRGQSLSISTTLSPDSQSASISFGDSWMMGHRWSNSISLSFANTNYTDELQKGTGSAQYSGWNDESVWPLGYNSYADWKKDRFATPAKQYLMKYKLISVTLGWNTGYTWIYDSGRLSVSGGVSIGVNHADFDNKYIPYEKLISKYAEDGFKFSNKITAGLQWDGRDYVTNTTRGYVLGTNVTYAGGILGGLSNYIKLSGSAAGYVKLMEVGKEGNEKNIMLALTSNVNFMFPQYYNASADDDPSNPGFGFHDAKLGATKYEMLYIDGMTIARGHDSKTGQSFLWDNMLELSYPLVKNILNFEVFASATAITEKLENFYKPDWYFSTGAGVRLKISGFPLGLYLVKTAVYTQSTDKFEWLNGSVFNSLNLVLAISTSLI